MRIILKFGLYPLLDTAVFAWSPIMPKIQFQPLTTEENCLTKRQDLLNIAYQMPDDFNPKTKRGIVLTTIALEGTYNLQTMGEITNPFLKCLT